MTAKHDRHVINIMVPFLVTVVALMTVLTIYGKVSGDVLLLLAWTATGYALPSCNDSFSAKFRSYPSKNQTEGRPVVKPPISKKGQHVLDNTLKIMDELNIDRSNDESKIAVESSGEFRVPIQSITPEAFSNLKNRMHGTEIQLEDEDC